MKKQCCPICGSACINYPGRTESYCAMGHGLPPQPTQEPTRTKPLGFRWDVVLTGNG